MEHLWTPEICTAHNAKGDRLRARLNEIAKAHNAPCQAYGCGSLISLAWQGRPLLDAKGELNLVKDHAPCAAAGGLFFFHMLERGLLVGTPALTYLTLPVTLTDAD